MLAERTLVMLLSDTESLEYLAREGLNIDIVPTHELRPVVEWSMAHHRNTGVAPTPAVLREHYGDLLDDREIDVEGDVEETIEWALDDLRGNYVRNKAGDFARRLVTAITEAQNDERVEVLAEFSTEIAATVQSLASRQTHVDLREVGHQILADYDVAAETHGLIQGMSLGVEQLDAYTGGIRDGELAVLGAPAKMGKSFALDYVALKNWEQGKVASLFTLENSIEMTRLRIACQACHISILEMQRGELSAEDYDTLKAWVNDVLIPSPTPLHIFSPMMVQRTPQAIVQVAKAVGTEVLVVDQLTFLENGQQKNNQQRHSEIRDILHDLKGMISTGRQRMSCLLAHQISRDGIKHAEQSGRLRMYDFADGSEVERTADWAFALWANDTMRQTMQMRWQTMAARRVPSRDFDMLWNITMGMIGVRNEVEV